MILLEFNRRDFSNAKDKLLDDIKRIKNGDSLNMGEIQTRWMSAISQCSVMIQNIRNKQQKNNYFTSEEKEMIKKLENEWKDVYKICRQYEMLLPRYNAIYQNNRLQTFLERTGIELTEELINYFDY